MDETLPVLYERRELLARIAQHLRRELVGDDAAAAQIPVPHAESGGPERQLETLLGLAALPDLGSQRRDGGRQLGGAFGHALLELLTDALQRGLGTLMVGDVDGENDDADDLTPFVAVRNLVGAHPALLPGRGLHRLDDARFGFARSDHLAIVAMVLFRLVRIELISRFANELRGRALDRLRRGAVGAQDAIVAVLVPDHRRDRVQHELQFRLLAAQRFEGPPPVGDVVHADDDSRHATRRVTLGRQLH